MWGLVLALLIAILIAGFAYLNSTVVTVNFLFWSAPALSLAIVILLSVLLGVLMAALVSIPLYLRKGKKDEPKSQTPPQN